MTLIKVDNRMKKHIAALEKAREAMQDYDKNESGVSFWVRAGDAWRRSRTEVFHSRGGASGTPWAPVQKFKTVKLANGRKKRVLLTKGRASMPLRAFQRNRERLFPSLTRKTKGSLNERVNPKGVMKEKDRQQVAFGTKIRFATFIDKGTKTMPARKLVEPTPKFMQDIARSMSEYQQKKIERVLRKLKK